MLIIAILICSCDNKSKSAVTEIVQTENDSIIKYQYDSVKKVKNGYYKVFDKQSNLIQEKTYVNDTLNGMEKNYHSNGKISSDFKWVKGEKNGVEKNYDINGKIEGEFIIEKGKYNGPFKYYFSDGKVKQEGKFINDNIEGELKTYYENGQLKEIVIMVSTKENGSFVEYYPNGKIKAKGSYKDGLLDCILEKYNEEKGELESKMICREQTCCTIWDSKKGNVKAANGLCIDIVKTMKDKCDGK